MRLIAGILAIVYFLIGLLIANNHHYLSGVSGLKGVISVILAVVLWPLVLLGVNLHLGAVGKESLAGTLAVWRDAIGVAGA